MWTYPQFLVFFQSGKGAVATMAYLTGLKKQINKANQFMSEKITGVEGSNFFVSWHLVTID